MLLGNKPTSEDRRRVILDTDANNEIDDQAAIVHALLSPELKVEGIIAAHYGKEKHKNSMEKSYQEVLHLLDLLGLDNEVPVYKGAAEAMKDHSEPEESEGAEFMIERALAGNKDNTLYIAYLGPLTDMASAYLMEPDVANNVVTLWIGGGWWPNGGREFNAGNDWIAADLMFKSEMNLIQYPRSTYRMMRIGVAEMEKFIMGKGAIGDYLTAIFKEWRITSPISFEGRSASQPRRWWVYGDSPAVGTMINPDWGYYLEVPAPRLNEDLTYEHPETDKTIELCVEVTAGEILEDFFRKLEEFAKDL